MKAFSPSRRFSMQLWWERRCSYLTQKGGHGPSHLCQDQRASTSLPRSEAVLHQRTSQDQQIVRTADSLRPEFGPRWRIQPRSIPEQFLLVEAIAMFVRVAQAVGWAEFSQRSKILTLPDKPTDPGVTRISTGTITDDLDERDLLPASRPVHFLASNIRRMSCSSQLMKPDFTLRRKKI